MRECEDLTAFCQKAGIHLIAFLPPYPHEVWEKMMAQGQRFSYIPKIAPAIRPMLESRGFEFYDFSDLAWLGANDSEAIDGYHCSDKAYLRIVLAMVRKGSRPGRSHRPECVGALLSAVASQPRIFKPRAVTLPSSTVPLDRKLAKACRETALPGLLE